MCAGQECERACVPGDDAPRSPQRGGPRRNRASYVGRPRHQHVRVDESKRYPRRDVWGPSHPRSKADGQHDYHHVNHCHLDIEQRPRAATNRILERVSWTRHTSRLLRRPYSPTVFNSASLEIAGWSVGSPHAAFRRRHVKRQAQRQWNSQTRGLEGTPGNLCTESQRKELGSLGCQGNIL